MLLLPKHQSGFTLLEMIVVIAIVIIMTVVALANLPDFRDKTSLDLLAQEVATTIRQAQVFGVATRRGVNVNSFPSFGINFMSSSYPLSGFELFADQGDPGYTSADQKIEGFNFRGGANIPSNGIVGCDSSSCPPVTDDFSIVFQRPDPDAHYYLGSSSPVDTAYSYVRITIAVKDKQRYVCVWQTGHIYVSQSQSC